MLLYKPNATDLQQVSKAFSTRRQRKTEHDSGDSETSVSEGQATIEQCQVPPHVRTGMPQGQEKGHFTCRNCTFYVRKGDIAKPSCRDNRHQQDAQHQIFGPHPHLGRTPSESYPSSSAFVFHENITQGHLRMMRTLRRYAGIEPTTGC